MNRLTKYLSFAAIGLLSLVSCYSIHEKSGNVFHYNETTGISSLDPAFAKNQAIMWAVHQVYNTLVEVNQQMQVVPSLATHWDISPDKLTYTFHLRKDVRFQEDMAFGKQGTKQLTATDVAYSFTRLIDKSVASPGSWVFNRKVDSIMPFRAINDSTFQLKLIHPYFPILEILCMQYCSIVPREAVDYYGNDFRRHPVGTGPFQFVRWEEGQALILKKNPLYFETDSAGNHLPYLGGIKVSFYDSKATEFLLFRQGKLDFINDVDASFKDEVLTRQGTLRKDWQTKIQLQLHPYLNVEYLGILVDQTNALVKTAPFRLKKVRQAMNYAIDRKKAILYLRNSKGIPAESGFIPEGLPSFNSKLVQGYSFNPVKSRALLAEAGFPGGQGLPVTKLYTIAIFADVADFIAKELEDAGIPVQVEILQKSLLLELMSSSKAVFFRGSWIADYPDAENYLSVFYSKNPAPPNYTRYFNPHFDSLFEQATSEQNDSLRYALYRAADQLVMDDAPVIPLWYDKVLRLVQPQITGFEPNSLNLLELRKTHIRK